MSKKKKIFFLLSATVLAITFFFPKNSSMCKCFGIKRERFLGEASRCFGIPYVCILEEGVIWVIFNEGTSYNQAKELLSSLGLQIEGTSPWEGTKFDPEYGTELKPTDLFEIEVEMGKEDEVINKLLQYPIVKDASRAIYPLQIP